MKTPVIVIDKDSNFTHKGGGNKTIEINARYYLLGHDSSYDVLDRALELQLLPAMVFANGSESECREWVLRNCKEPYEHTNGPWQVTPDSTCSGAWLVVHVKDDPETELFQSSTFAVSHGHYSSIYVEHPEHFIERDDAGEIRANAYLVATAPDLLALLEQYHKSFPTKESGKLIAQAKGWI